MNKKKEQEIIKMYLEGNGLEILCKNFHLGKLTIKKILKENNIPIKKVGGQKLKENFIVSDWKIEKYPIVDGYRYIAKSKDGKVEYSDYMNQGGYLTTYIKNFI